jgi:hypothetical protein
LKKVAFPFILIIAVIFLSACASSSGVLTVNESWARPASKGENGAAYFLIENGTIVDDVLLGVSSDIATANEVHMSMVDGNGVMSMQMQAAVVIPAKEKVEFKPGGLHVMFVDLTRDLKIGDTFTLILRFEKAGEITMQVEVKEQ